jgi:hypothetical protein
MVCLRNICVNTLNKGDSIFNNNMYHLKPDIDWLCVKRKERRKGMEKVEAAYKQK